MTPIPPDSKSNGWNEWANHVLLELERHSRELAETKQEMVKMSNTLSNLKGQATTWGAVAGVLGSVAVSMLLKYLK